MKKSINLFISILIIIFGLILTTSYILPGIFLILCGLTISPLFYKIVNEKIKNKLMARIIISVLFFVSAMATTPIDTENKNEELNENITNNITEEVTSENTTIQTTEEVTSENTTIQTSLETTLSDEKEEIINLKFGEKGEYGKEDKYNIRYYIPSGNYRVIDNSGSSFGFFVVKNEKVKNSDGKLEDVILQNVKFESGAKEKEITIPKDTHIILFVNSDFNFIKIQN